MKETKEIKPLSLYNEKGMSKKYESNFGYLSTGERFLRVYKNDDNTLQKTVVTELYKVSKMYEEINLVIS